MKQRLKTERLGNVCKVVMAGDVLAVTPAAKHKSRRTPWMIVVSGETEPLSITVADPAGVRVAEHLKVGDFVTAEATLIPRGARCEIRSLLIQSNRESRLPVVQVTDAGKADTEDQEACLPWEDTGS